MERLVVAQEKIGKDSITEVCQVLDAPAISVIPDEMEEDEMEDVRADEEEEEEEMEDAELDRGDDSEMKRLARLMRVETGEVVDGEEEEGDDDDEDEGLEDVLGNEELLKSEMLVGKGRKEGKKPTVEGIQRVKATSKDRLTAMLIHKANLMLLLLRGIQNR